MLFNEVAEMCILDIGYSVVLYEFLLQSSNNNAFVYKNSGLERWEIPGSNPGCVCRLSLSEFSVLFSETRVNMG